VSEERTRWIAQADRVLARLQQGPASNAELATISLKYTSRISDLRVRGHVIEAFDHDHGTGECWYRLVTPRGFDSVPAVRIPVPKGQLF
jgi:hypothetical protein